MTTFRWSVAALAIFGGITVLALAIFVILVLVGLMSPAGETAAFYWLVALLVTVVVGAWLLLVVWSYVDAERRGMNGALWALLVFVLGFPLGPLIYLVYRTTKSTDSNSESAPEPLP